MMKIVHTPLLIACLLLAAGCATTDRAYEGTVGVTDPDSVTLRPTLAWTVPPREMGISPFPQGDGMLYLSFSNTSGTPMPYLDGQLRERLASRGYRITTDPKQADFAIIADIRYYGEEREADGTVPTATGAVAGGIAGAVIGHNVNEDSSTSRNIGAAAGALLGGALGHIAANRNKNVELELIVDVDFYERKPGQAGVSSGRIDNDFDRHQNRVTLQARSINLTLQDALPHFERSLAYAVADALPQR